MSTNLGASKPETHMKEAGRVRGGGRISPPPLTLIRYALGRGLSPNIALFQNMFWMIDYDEPDYDDAVVL